MAPSTPTPVPIIDSHIHLYPESEIDTLAWYKSDSPLGGQHSVAEFRAAAEPASSSDAPSPLAGFIFVETDRKNDSGRDWTAPLAEISWISRIATGRPRAGEGHTAADAALCLGVVPWAPLPLGPAQLEKYLEQAEEAAGEETWSLIKGFRYLLQDKEAGTGLGDEFVAGLKMLGKKGFVFEVGVDQHRRGRTQLDECVEMIDRAHDGVPEEEKVVFIISKLSPPLLLVSFPSHMVGRGSGARSANPHQTTSASPTSASSAQQTRLSWPGAPPCSPSPSAARPT
jgi:L-rhamnono-1,4-lactonase